MTILDAAALPTSERHAIDRDPFRRPLQERPSATATAIDGDVNGIWRATSFRSKSEHPSIGE
jgi:hypothetical protein